MSAKIHTVHAYYEQYGGEDNSYREELEVFRALGYEPIELTASNADLRRTALTAFNAVFHLGYFLRTLQLILRHKPQFMYVNNIWPAISPSPLLAARLFRVPTLQAVRNYRLLCASAMLDDDGRCISCGSLSHPWSCVREGCYRESKVQSAVVSMSSSVTKLLCRKWNRHKYLTTSVAVMSLLRSHGIDALKVRVRPNFISQIPEISENDIAQQAVYVGRLSTEKGVLQLAGNWPSNSGQLKLIIVGDGPLKARISKLAMENPNIEYLGKLSKDGVNEILRNSLVSFVPSQWAEPFGRSAIESMSVGTPVVCSSAGALPGIIGDAGIVLHEMTPQSIMDACNQIGSRGLAIRAIARARFLSEYDLESAIKDMRHHLEVVKG